MILDILNELASDNSRLAKEAILRREINNDLLKRFFDLALNPYTQFFQRKIPTYVAAHETTADSLDSVLSSLGVLSSRSVTGNDAIKFLQKLLSSLTVEDAAVLERVIEKDPKCGVSEATVNKIWPGLIPTYPVMLCSAYDQKLADRLHWQKGVYIQCLSGDWEVETELGHIKIRDIVENKISVRVKSYNEKTSTFEFKPILNHFNNGDEKCDWYEIEYEENGVLKKTKHLTYNHKVYTLNRGWVRVEDLQYNDLLI